MATGNVNATEARVGRVARKVCADVRTWSRQLSGSIGRPELEAQVSREVLSYALYLTETHDLTSTGLESEQFHRTLRAECVALFLRWAKGRRGSGKWLVGGKSEGEDTAVPTWQERRNPDKAAFEAFCHATGLGSDVLVGKEKNLAGLVFYIVIFGLCAGGTPSSGAQAQRLLRGLQNCRLQLQRRVPRWLEETLEEVTMAPRVLPMRQIENAVLL